MEIVGVRREQGQRGDRRVDDEVEPAQYVGPEHPGDVDLLRIVDGGHRAEVAHEAHEVGDAVARDLDGRQARLAGDDVAGLPVDDDVALGLEAEVGDEVVVAGRVAVAGIEEEQAIAEGPRGHRQVPAVDAVGLGARAPHVRPRERESAAVKAARAASGAPRPPDNRLTIVSGPRALSRAARDGQLDAVTTASEAATPAVR